MIRGRKEWNVRRVEHTKIHRGLKTEVLGFLFGFPAWTWVYRFFRSGLCAGLIGRGTGGE
jgi:hypothetical protein